MRRAAAVSGLAIAAAVLLPAVTARADEERARFFVNGTFASGALAFDEKRTFEEFAEAGTIDTRYENQPGPGFEAGLLVRFSRHFGAAASYYASRRDGTARYDAALPHPLYLGKPRAAAGELGGLRYKENAGLLDLVYTTSGGAFDVTLAAGGTLFKVQTDLVRQIHYTQSYPYDTVTVTDVSKASSTANAFGFNVSGGLDYRAGRHFGFGGLVRYLRGTVTLQPSPGNKTRVKAGGLQLAGGVRAYF